MVEVVIEGSEEQTFTHTLTCDDATGLWPNWMMINFAGNYGVLSGGFLVTSQTPDPDTATLTVTHGDITATFTLKPQYD